jgi:8-oxo-dGTP pyrophosphatase MutT (NUDIX family)
MSEFERTDGEEVYEGAFTTLRKDTFRHSDGEEVTREYVVHPGAVVVVAFDGDGIYTVVQPREAVGQAELVELPAGKLDKEGEEPLEAAQRELAEEIGKGARNWRSITKFWTSPGILTEEMHLFVATDLYDEQAESDEDERIEIRKIPLDGLDEAIASCRDAKTLVGLLWVRAYGLD